MVYGKRDGVSEGIFSGLMSKRAVEGVWGGRGEGSEEMLVLMGGWKEVDE